MKEKPKKISTKKIILVALGAAAGLIVVYAIGLWIAFLVTFMTYHNEEDGVEIAYPKTWTVREHPAQGVLVAFLSPKDNALDTFMENVNLSTYDMSKDPQSTEAYAKIMTDQLLMLFSDIKLLNKIPFPVGGQSGYRMIFSAGRGDEAKTIAVYAFTIETMGYNLLYIGSNEQYRKQHLLLDAMALSIRVKY